MAPVDARIVSRIVSTLTEGAKYELSGLEHVGWTGADDATLATYHDGARFADYFDEDGQYLGADFHGVEPTFAGVPRPQPKMVDVRIDRGDGRGRPR
jgi:hypothetical protein